jgi:hypothetical protein
LENLQQIANNSTNSEYKFISIQHLIYITKSLSNLDAKVNPDTKAEKLDLNVNLDDKILFS